LHYYPKRGLLFDPDPGALVFEYLGIQDDHHMARLKKSSPHNPDMVKLFHDHRETYRTVPQFIIDTQRDEPVELVPDGEHSESYFVLLDSFTSLGKNDLRERINRAIMFSELRGYPLIFAISFSEDTAKIMKPFDVYKNVHSLLAKETVDWTRTHITFSPTANFGSSDSYLPKNQQAL
jgi:hypothetical protein